MSATRAFLLCCVLLVHACARPSPVQHAEDAEAPSPVLDALLAQLTTVEPAAEHPTASSDALPAPRADVAAPTADQPPAPAELQLASIAGADEPRTDYQMGSADQIHISVPGVDELTGDYHVGGDGTVMLPLIGSIETRGHTEAEMAAEIQRRLERDYVHHAEVLVTVTGFQGQRASVLGAVRNPGFYPLQGVRETVLDLLMRAGGPSSTAGSSLYLTTEHDLRHVTIDLTGLYEDRPVPALNTVVRGGDTIQVQEGEPVFVEGWVERPAPYPFQRGTTVCQVITKAGGLHFGASSHGITLLRPEPSGTLHEYTIDYARVSAGEEQDLHVQPGDRIRVAGAAPKVAAWGLYRFVAGIISVGIGSTIALF